MKTVNTTIVLTLFLIFMSHAAFTILSVTIITIIELHTYSICDRVLGGVVRVQRARAGGCATVMQQCYVYTAQLMTQ